MTQRPLDGIRHVTPQEPPRTPNVVHGYVVRCIVAAAFFAIGIVGLGVVLADDLGNAATLYRILPPGHYLVLFQNNSEQRPTGGFIGSFAVVDITSQGYENLQIDTNIYKRDNAFTERVHVAPPTPLVEISGNRWAMRDANWEADFRDAAQRVAWFYSREGGEAVDGVIAINATVIQDMLRLTGPLEIPGEIEQLTTETFFDTLHYKIEKEYFEDPENVTENEPKQILVDILPQLKARTRNPLVAAQIPRFLSRQLEEKHILIFHRDADVQRRIEQAGWAGTLRGDATAVAINNANLGGQKSSLNVRQETTITVERTGNTWRYQIEVHRIHTGDGIWPDHANYNYIRIFGPSEAVLDTALRNGRDITSEVATELYRNRTSWGAQLDTPPGGESTLALSYSRPVLPAEPFALHYEKQPGTLIEHLNVSVDDQVVFSGEITQDTLVTY